MKKTIKLIALTLFLSISFISYAQPTNLIFFSEEGEHFSVILNGILQNAKPETNIKITGLPAPSYKLKIIFEDPKIPELNKTLIYQQGTETTFNIKKNNKREFVCRFLSQVPIDEVSPPPPDQHVIVYTTVPATNITINQTNVTQNNTTVNTSVTGNAGDVNLNINATGTAVSSTPGQGQGHPEGNHLHENHYEMPGYHGDVGCPWPMTDLDFKDAKETIASKSFEDSKLSIAKQVTSSNCLFSSEVKEIMDLFSFEASRLEFAKFAYRYTFDVGNYYKVNEAFRFESSIDELNNFIEGKKK
jgi:hypothetical protein